MSQRNGSGRVRAVYGRARRRVGGGRRARWCGLQCVRARFAQRTSAVRGVDPLEKAKVVHPPLVGVAIKEEAKIRGGGRRAERTQRADELAHRNAAVAVDVDEAKDAHRVSER